MLADTLSDPERLAALQRTGLLDGTSDHTLNRLTELTRRVLGVPVAAVTLVAADRQYFTSHAGLTHSGPLQTPLSHSLCQFTLERDTPLAIDDVRADPRYASHREITELGVAAYAGVALRDPDGRPLGALCAADRSPREWSEDQLRTLEELAVAATTQIALRMDIAVRKDVEARLAAAEQRFRMAFHSSPIGCALVGLDGRFLQVNAAMGQITGHDPERLLALSFQEVIHPDDLDAVHRLVRELVAGEAPHRTLEKRYERVGGQLIWIKVNASLARDEQGEPIYFIVQVQDIDEPRALREHLAEAQAVAQVGSWRVDLIGERPRATWSVELRRMLGWPLDVAEGTIEDYAKLIHPDDRRRVLREFDGFLRHGRAVESAHRLVDVGPSARHVMARGRCETDASGRVVRAFGTVQDVTARREIEDELRCERDHSAAITAAMSEGYALTVEGEIVEVNQAACTLTGFSRRELIGARVPFPFWPPERVGDMSAIRDRVVRDGGETFEATFMRRDGTRFDAEVTARAAVGRDGQPLGFVNTMRDVSERKRYQAELERLARTDVLTGLANRRSFEEQLDGHLSRAGRSGDSGALVLVDVDHFKRVNDSRGHAAGDEILVLVAKALTDRLRDSDVIARIGGDEFAALLPHATSQDAAKIAATIVETVRGRTRDCAHGAVTVSVGAAPIHTDPAPDVATVMAEVDRAMYLAKLAGRDGHAVAPGTPPTLTPTLGGTPRLSPAGPPMPSVLPRQAVSHSAMRRPMRAP